MQFGILIINRSRWEIKILKIIASKLPTVFVLLQFQYLGKGWVCQAQPEIASFDNQLELEFMNINAWIDGCPVKMIIFSMKCLYVVLFHVFIIIIFSYFSYQQCFGLGDKNVAMLVTCVVRWTTLRLLPSQQLWLVSMNAWWTKYCMSIQHTPLLLLPLTCCVYATLQPPVLLLLLIP